MPPVTNQDELTASVINTLLDVIEKQNPLLMVHREEYRAQLTQQFEVFLISMMMEKLSATDHSAFESMLAEHTHDKEMHNKFLAEHVQDFDVVLTEATKTFIQAYSEAFMSDDI